MGAQRDHSEDFVAAVHESTQGRGADVILDMVGGEYVQRNITAAAVDGRIALIAVQGGARAEIDLRQIMVKRLKLMGATLRPQSSAAKGRLARDLLSDVSGLGRSVGFRNPDGELRCVTGIGAAVQRAADRLA